MSGLTWAKVPWARQTHGEPEAIVDVVGVLSADAFTLTERPQRPPPVNEEKTLTNFHLPCEPPKDGWKIRDRNRVGLQDEQAATAYAEKRPEHSNTWIHWHAAPRRADRAIFTPDKGILVFTFVQNLETHRHRLEQLWGGPLCVAAAELTSEVQRGIVARAVTLLRREGRRHGLLCSSFGASGGGPDSGAVNVHGLAWDSARLARWLSVELAGYPVEVDSPLAPMPP